MEKFSKIELSFQNFIEEYEEEKRIEASRPEPPFPDEEMTEEKRQARIKKAMADYWYFDTTYFSPELYDDYCEPNRMLIEMVELVNIYGVHFILGPRDHGKSVTAKKLLLWLALNGQHKVLGSYAETTAKSSAVLKDIWYTCTLNQKILNDYNIEFYEANSYKLTFTASHFKDANDLRYMGAFSEGRSVKGFIRGFGRPSFMLADDTETVDSSFEKDPINKRIEKIGETAKSLRKNSVFFILANDFKVVSAIHILRLQWENNLLPKGYFFHIYKAWQYGHALWKRYKAKTEAELRALIMPLNEADWQGNYQMNPIPPEGDFFKREYYLESQAPSSLKCVLYCDPNLSKKNKGDTTAIVVFGYSAKKDMYYIVDAICHSYSDSNKLLQDVLGLKAKYPNIYAIGFDGNVSQEATWSQHVRNQCTITGLPFPAIEYKRYHVNDLAKNFQITYNGFSVAFPVGFSKSEVGETFLNQFYSFTGTKGSSKDDAPDALICGFEFLHERKLARGNESKKPIPIEDYYNFRSY